MHIDISSLREKLKELTYLREEIAAHNRLYYEKDSPIIPDKVFDEMLESLQKKDKTIYKSYPKSYKRK